MKRLHIRTHLGIRGFTLIEVLIYVAVIGGTMSALVLFALSISNSGEKTYAAQEVHATMRVAMDIMRSKIRAADAVIDVQPEMLSLQMADASKNPTVLRLNGALLELQEGVDVPAALTSGNVQITNLEFSDMSGDAARANIRIQMTGSYNGSEDAAFRYTQRLEAAVSLRQ